MPKAKWNGTVIAEAAGDRCQLVEGNTYFPPDAVKAEHLRDSDQTSHCPWKGDAKYKDVVVGGEVNPAAAWTYPSCKEEARHIEGFVAFWKGIEVED